MEEEIDPVRKAHRIAKYHYSKNRCIECGQHSIALGERREDRQKDHERIPSFLCSHCLKNDEFLECGKCSKEFVPSRLSHMYYESHDRKVRCFHCITWGPRSSLRVATSLHTGCGVCPECQCGCGLCHTCFLCDWRQRKNAGLVVKLRDKIKAVWKDARCDARKAAETRIYWCKELKGAHRRLRRAYKLGEETSAHLRALDAELREAQKRKDVQKEEEEEEEEGDVVLVMDGALLSLLTHETEENAQTQKAKLEAKQAHEEVRKLEEEASMLEAELDLAEALDEEEENDCAKSVFDPHISTAAAALTSTSTSSMSNSGGFLDLSMRSCDGSTRDGDRSEANSNSRKRKLRDVFVAC
uniref:Uncharacterized protein n=1 Tax=Chromera velia CCMP2878 TaxID=1169474 RepID=A0A0G4HNR0_9ALVE|eukprot:Cvel_29631.t1-p1 / transcript=Cvel_29631.t1 / gene=Cvel_29631 / organism=Chromera_velia_CCMP2878 / gene_product=hypothetical protein / transcript_product=hypothetical protein / location=Cvel_scaffold4089:5094-8228(-) / protein_length=355 / sequence_SO=supercontig / SO=protein_coding / is_pseudo=false